MIDAEDVSNLTGYENLAKQGVAGVAENVLGSPAAPAALSWVPNGAFGLYSLLETGQTMATRAMNKYLGTSIPDAHAATDIYKAGVDNTNNLVGVDEPKTWQETLARSLPSALLPIPGVQAGEAATAAGKIAKGIADLVTPFNTSRSMTQAVLGTALPTGVTELVHQDDPDYLGLTNGTTAAQPVDFADFVQQKQQQPQTGDFADFVTQQQNAGPSNFADFVGAKDDAGWNFKSVVTAGAAVTAAALVLGGGLAAYRNTIRAPLMQSTALSGSKPVTDAISPIAKINGAMFDYNAPVFDALDQTAGAASDGLRAKYALAVSPSSVADKIKDIAQTGIWPNGQRGPKLAVILQSLGNLGPDKTKTFDDILTAMDKQEQMFNENVNVWGNAGTQTKTYAELDMLKNLRNTNPDVAALVDQTHQFMGSARQYALDKGLITPAEFMDMQRNRSNYMPDLLNQTDESWLNKLFAAPSVPAGGVETDIGPLKKRATLQEGVAPGEGLVPSQALPHYLQQIVGFGERNDARLGLIDQIKGTDFAQKVDKPGANVVTVLRNGAEEHYQIQDDNLWNALIHTPTLVPSIFNTTRRIMTEFTVGTLNPAFMAINAGYEALTSAVTRKGNRGVGLVSEGLNKLGADGAADAFNKYVPFDPTNLVAPFTGAARGMAADTAIKWSNALEASLNSGGVVSRLLGPQLTKQLADIMGNAYENSVLHVARQEGMGSAPTIEHWATGLSVSDPADYAPTFARMVSDDLGTNVRAMPIIRNYLALTRLMHNGTRLQHMASNLRDDMSDTDLAQLAYDTRNLTGDVSTHGSNVGMQFANQSLPWFNVSAQTGKALVKRAVENPAAFTSRLTALGMTGLAYLTSQMVNNPAMVDTYVNKWTAQDRADRIPYIGTDGEVKHEFSPFQEFRLMWSPLVEGFLTLSGLKSEHYVPTSISQTFMKAINNALNGHNWSDTDWTDMGTGEKEAASQAMPSVLPPVGAAALAAYGKNPRSFGQPGGNLSDLHPEQITGEKTDAIADRFITQNWEQAIAQLTGSLGQATMNSIDAFIRTHKAGFDGFQAAGAAWKNFVAHEEDQLTSVGGPELWDWSKSVTSQDVNAKLVEAKVQQLRNMRAALLSMQSGQLQTKTPRPGIDDYTIFVPPDISGSELGTVAAASNPTMQTMGRTFLPQLQGQFKDMDEIKASPNATAEPMTQRRMLNDKAMEIRNTYAQALKFMRDQETLIGQQYKIPNFRFDDLDVSQLKKTPQS